MGFYDKITCTWRLPEWLGVGDDFQDGFIAGLALFLVLFLVLLIVKRISTRGKKSSGIMVDGNMGHLFITTSAVREFVSRVLKEFPDIRLRGLKLLSSGSKVDITLEVGVTSQSGLPALRDAVQSRVITEVEEKLGLGQPPKVNLRVRSLRVDGTPSIKEDVVSLGAEDILEP